ncbi:MAG: hypothetical protein PHN84_10565 [Desulfuromonadaceae bacterium]|nr:hypothetical protein [Desulfuromonadaceae bacterium]MDD2853994.1 hypothetical protein [Desulfuromonadaceae bacterium]
MTSAFLKMAVSALFIIGMAGDLYAEPPATLTAYAKFSNNQVQLKWLIPKYSDANSYTIYRGSKGEPGRLLATLTPVSDDALTAMGFDKDYREFIHPYKDVKTLDDSIMVAKTAKQVDAFRILRLMQDNRFAKHLGQYFVDTDVKPGMTYHYRIELLNNDKTIARASIDVATKETSGSTVMWVQAQDTEKGVTLNWENSAEFSFYHLYRKLDGEKEHTRLTKQPIYVAPSSSVETRYLYQDTALKEGQRAHYYVRKVDQFGDEGKASYQVSGEIKVDRKPARVTNIFVKNSDRKISLRWKKGENILGYNIYRSLNHKTGFKKINSDPVKEEAYFDHDFSTGKSYYYIVTAVNMHGESTPSDAMLAYARDVTPPDAPTALTFSVTPGTAHLKWQGVATPDLLGYRVYMSMDRQAESWAMITKKEVAEPSYLHERAKTLSRHNYYYRVTAVDKAFNESAPSNIIEVKLPDVTKPEQPVVDQFHVYPGKILIQWSQIALYDFSHYNIYRKTGAALTKLNDVPLKVLLYTDAKPDLGLNEYVVTSVDQSGNESDRKVSLAVHAHDGEPATVSGLSVKPVTKGVELSFVCGDEDYTGFEVYRSSGSDKKYHNISGFRKGTRFVDTRVVHKQVYFYMIKAFDRSGNVRESRSVKIKY